MNTKISRALERANRVREFCKAHPVDDTAYPTAVASIEANLTRGAVIAARQHDGLAAGRTARRIRRGAKEELHEQMKYLVAVLEKSALERPELAEQLELPRPSLPYLRYVTTVKAKIALARPHLAFLVSKGLSETLLDSAERLADQILSQSDAARSGRREHIGARADFELLGIDLFSDVKVLTGIYRLHFRNDRELMAEWEAVRLIPGLPQPKLTVEEGGAEPVEPPTPPTEGGSTRAA